ncbi:MAG: phosphoribosylformylglycinamidine cyclo-ligase [Nitrospirae bacterium]|nr:MAG: phosphoribosylformylglycinamidine cyclo-ligase [Nitrospirota bacterium]
MISHYRQAGVNITAGEELVRRIRPLVRQTDRQEVLSELGGFGGFFRVPIERFQDPVLVSSTDGVGTKLKLAFALDRHDTVGIDLVAMCVNDILVSGAEPLFFLDYLAVGQLVVSQAEAIIQGIVEGCRQAGCTLLGGETAEMPTFYHAGEYDLAGFAVGIVERSQLVTGQAIRPGHILIGLASSGLHSNGYALARKVLFEQTRLPMTRYLAEVGGVLGEILLTPTRIYVKSVLALLRDYSLSGLAHITGGGLTGNIPRILPATCRAIIDRSAWKIPPLFSLLQRLGRIPDEEMYRVFNMGVGMVLVVPPEQVDAVIDRARSLQESAFQIGWIETRVSDQAPLAYTN